MSEDLAASLEKVTMNGEEAGEEGEDNVTPWDVTASSAKGVDYEKLISMFVFPCVLQSLYRKVRMQKTGARSHWTVREVNWTSSSSNAPERNVLRPQVRISWLYIYYEINFRDLSAILDRKEQGKPFFLYTGRGPSSGSLHLGHLIPFIFTKWLQEVFDVPLIIQVCLIT